MALVGVELDTLVFEPDAQTTRPPPCSIDLFIAVVSYYFSAQTKFCPCVVALFQCANEILFVCCRVIAAAVSTRVISFIYRGNNHVFRGYKITPLVIDQSRTKFFFLNRSKLQLP